MEKQEIRTFGRRHGKKLSPRKARLVQTVLPKITPNKSENADILDTVVRFAGEFGIPPYDEENGQGIIRHVLVREGFISGEILVCLAINADTLPQAENLVDRLLALPMEGKCIKSVCLNINRKRTNVILGDRTVRLYGDP